MNTFQRFYLWGMHAKFYMGLYFSALVFLSGLLTLLYGGSSLGIWPLFQMLILSVLVAFLQALLLPAGKDLARGSFSLRALFFLLFSSLASFLSSRFLGWFTLQQNLCSVLLGALMLFGCAALLFGQKLEREADSLRLNRLLHDLQEK